MKRRFSSVLAGVILAGFLAGGWLAPVLHRVQHAQEQYAAQQAAPSCTHEGHEAPAAETEGAQVKLEGCWLLMRHVMSGAPSPVWEAAPPQHEAERSAVVSTLYASRIEGRSAIRGPPHS